MKKALLKTKTQTNKIGLGISAVILGSVILGMIAVFCDTHTYGMYFKDDGTPKFDRGVFPNIGPQLLGYFQFAQAIFAAIVATINIVEFAFVQKGKLTKVDNWLHVLNLVCATALGFDFFFTYTFCIPMCASTGAYDWQYTFTGSNFIFNILLPVLGVLLYVFCFKGYSLKRWWHSLIGIIPVFLYFTIYMIIGLVNAKNGVISSQIDIYWIGYRNCYWVIAAAIFSTIVAGGIAVGLRQLNKIGHLNRWMLAFVINVFLSVAAVWTTAFMFNTNLTDDRFREGFSMWESALTRFLLFTHLSCWFILTSSIIYSVYTYKMYKGEIKQIPVWAQVIRISAVTAGFVTLFVQVIMCVSPMLNSKYTWHYALTIGYLGAFRKHLILEHFLIPALAMTSYALVERGSLKWKHLLYAAIPITAYAVLYVILLYTHIGQPLRKDDQHLEYKTWWDMYNLSALFKDVGKYVYWFAPALVYGIELVIVWVFWLMNRKIHFEQPKKGPVWAELKRDIASRK